MAQLNPNFEIDFSDINSYEQIQLINDTQLAKENLLMHRAYKEPSDDEIIRNQFSSFTFVDFCPKLFSIKQPLAGSGYEHLSTTVKLSPGPGTRFATRCFELETFSDLFERINTWLKLNKDWRVVSMETLVYDCTSQFNHKKSSVYSNYLSQNTRGLRLFLSPSKSRFSGPQKIGCINVVPRKVSGSHTRPEDPPTYETLDEILNRLNELLLTRPIEGRILSVETLTLPMANGYVDTELNYYVDSRLNSLYDDTYTFGSGCATKSDPNLDNREQDSTAASAGLRNESLIDILRVYYEFGPQVCGLVNLIDFVPRFYSSQSDNENDATVTTHESSGQEQSSDNNLASKPVPKIAATESLTRLVRRSLAWFESERKRILNVKADDDEDHAGETSRRTSNQVVNLKLCNLQVHQKTLLKSHLLQVTPTNANSIADTRTMTHERMDSKPPVVCSQCSISSGDAQIQDWCSHLLELTQPYHLKFVRLAYIVPVSTSRIVRPSRPLRGSYQKPKSRPNQKPSETSGESSAKDTKDSDQRAQDLSSSSTSSSSEPSTPSTPSSDRREPMLSSENDQMHEHHHYQQQVQAELLKACENEEDTKQTALAILKATNERHKVDEQAHQLQQVEGGGLNDSPIGQLTYRLFAPCQLVASSSCFSINPVNSSSPLARRGSVDINGSGISSDNAHPSTSLLASSSSNSLSQRNETHHVVTSFGAFFPALSHEIMTSSQPAHDSYGAGARLVGGGGTVSGKSVGGNGNRFTTNEFEPVDAIRRRMEVYVTTNSMKVIAGETLIVHLSDALSCLSTAIEHTVVMAKYGPKRTSDTWVSVYVLYAAVEEPQLPAQLLAQQKMRDLSLIEEGTGHEEEEDALVARANKIFDDDFKGCLNEIDASKKTSTTNPAYQSEQQLPTSDRPSASDACSVIRVEQNPLNSSLTLYNSAYDRTVALPTPPENHLSENSFDPADYLVSDGLLIHDSPFADMVVHKTDIEAMKKRRKKVKKRNRHDDSQCLIM